MHGVLREESAQATVEYAIVTVALLSIVLANEWTVQPKALYCPFSR